MPNRTASIRLPLIVFSALAIGLFLGAKLFQNPTSERKSLSAEGGGKKLKELLQFIENYYVDTIAVENLTDEAIVAILKKLDPHSSYVPLKDLEFYQAQLQNGFDGIGIEFRVVEDTLRIMATLPNSPAEKAGLQAGDRLVAIDGENITAKQLESHEVFDRLRGKKGTKVVLKIERFYPTRKILTLPVVRDRIPTKTVEVAYLLDAKTGYMKVSRFGEDTYKEFRAQLSTFVVENKIDRLILDLRDNKGGYLDRAVKMVDEVLAGEELIVYTEGKNKRFNNREYAQEEGLFESGKLIVLIDEGSASASEIVAGALQDHDRALLVGRRSFGKGLVQKPMELHDGSEVRLTISRYYTPSGRSIQKPYSDSSDYEAEYLGRYENGELYHLDSNKFDKNQIFKTKKGRTVYGGGGITPDIFVPADSTWFSPLLQKIHEKGILRDLAVRYWIAERQQWSEKGFEAFKENYRLPADFKPHLLRYLSDYKIAATPQEIEVLLPKMHLEIRAEIAYLLWQYSGKLQILHPHDPIMEAALQNWDAAF
ncbi:S41 family peptidase [Hugenholtzia roseola]|uniref:S41 family peptidase n=1 Tax=Hugenholtzia roseola TaxID=1002 RepID=UPI0003FE1EB9|nr:S41 family peptidase [Hugenholtzia roseola]